MLGVQQAEASCSSIKGRLLPIVGLQKGGQIQEQKSHLGQNLLKPPHRIGPRHQVVEEEGVAVESGGRKGGGGIVEGGAEVGDSKGEELTGADVAVVGTLGEGPEGFNDGRGPEER